MKNYKILTKCVQIIDVDPVFALDSVLDFFDFDLGVINQLLGIFPLYANGLGWVVPTLAVALIGYLLDYFKGKVVHESGLVE